ALMFEYAFNLPAEAEMIHKAVEASLEEGVVTEDINREKASTTSDVGDWLADFIQKNF
ncbi:MAG: 3-isopropylmalate dehydrogenase, partial [Bacteroidetes bacterium]